MPKLPAFLVLAALLLVSGPAAAHTEVGVPGGLLSGFLHPLTGLDHLVAIFHGYAHGSEMPGASNALAYGVGFVVATGLLHALGVLTGALTRWPAGAQAVCALGAAIAGLGGVFLLSMSA